MLGQGSTTVAHFEHFPSSKILVSLVEHRGKIQAFHTGNIMIGTNISNFYYSCYMNDANHISKDRVFFPNTTSCVILAEKSNSLLLVDFFAH